MTSSTSGTYTVTDGQVVLAFDQGANLGETFSASWSLYRDTLTFERAGGLPTPYLIKAWTRVPLAESRPRRAYWSRPVRKARAARPRAGGRPSSEHAADLARPRTARPHRRTRVLAWPIGVGPEEPEKQSEGPEGPLFCWGHDGGRYWATPYRSDLADQARGDAIGAADPDVARQVAWSPVVPEPRTSEAVPRDRHRFSTIVGPERHPSRAWPLRRPRS